MGFKAVADESDFLDRAQPEFFKYQTEQEFAMQNNLFAPDIKAEMDKMIAADLVIFQFPLWWFSMPAIMKGWIDRVFAAGLVYGGGKWYDKGGMKGKRAMLAVTTGGPENIYTRDGINGDIETILFPIEHGMLYFAGFEVLPSFIAYAVAGATQEKREEYLADYQKRLLNWRTTEPIPFHPLSDYDFKLQLKAEYKM